MENFKGGVEIKVLLFSVHHSGLFCVAKGMLTLQTTGPTFQTLLEL